MRRTSSRARPSSRQLRRDLGRDGDGVACLFGDGVAGLAAERDSSSFGCSSKPSSVDGAAGGDGCARLVGLVGLLSAAVMRPTSLPYFGPSDGQVGQHL